MWAEGQALSVDEAAAYTRRARGERKRPSFGWDTLTPTEMEVVRLVAQGLANPAIGERMFSTSGTVKTHLKHVRQTRRHQPSRTRSRGHQTPTGLANEIGPPQRTRAAKSNRARHAQLSS